VTSAAGVVRAAREAGMSGPLTPKKVFALARRGDPTACEVVATEARRWALGLAVVVATALAAAQDWLFDPARMLDRKELVV
jgi:predicted NBD/HSP70 family sugar kinase